PVILRERPETDLDIKVFGLIPDLWLFEAKRVRVCGSPGFLSLTEMALYDLLTDVEESPTTEKLPDLLQRVPEVAVEILVRVASLGRQLTSDQVERLCPLRDLHFPEGHRVPVVAFKESSHVVIRKVVRLHHVRPFVGDLLSCPLTLRVQLRHCFVLIAHVYVSCPPVYYTPRLPARLRETLTYPTRTRPRTGCTDTADSALAVSAGTLVSGVSGNRTEGSPRHHEG